MTVEIGDFRFERHHYDPRGDVLYLSTEGYEGPPAKAFATPEGHGVEYDGAGQLVSMTLVNVRWLLDRDGCLAITSPTVRVPRERLAGLIDGD